MKVLPRYVAAFIAGALVVGVLVQAFLAGAGLFGWASIQNHRNVGYLIWFLAPVLPVVALPAWPDRRTGLLTLLIVVLIVIQPFLVYAKDTIPLIAALHPVNAMLLFWTGIVVARRYLRLAREESARSAVADQPPALTSSALAQPSVRTDTSAPNAATTSTTAAAMEASRSPD